VRYGAPLDVLRDVVAQSGAAAVYFNRDYTSFARARDAAAVAVLQARGVEVQSFKEAALVEPDELGTKAGTPYTIYAPYHRQWLARIAAQPPAAPEPLPAFAPPPEAIGSIAIPIAADLGFATQQLLPPGREAAGLARLEAFCQLSSTLGIGEYHSGRSRPALAATSRLSPYLRYGCVAPLACLRAALGLAGQASTDAQRQSVATWIGELAWRDFYMQIMTHFPHVLDGAYKREYDAIAWENSEWLYHAWCSGRTGFPIVDAAMRQLSAEAWMHNRARMIAAAFLTKDLLVDWRWGERYFMRQLADGDHAANNGGWQWAAGTGPNAQPYFRIFNPTGQGAKFDPRGEYVRRYVPELARVPDRYIHQPWAMPAAEQRRAGVQIGGDYPAPVVDHALQRGRALDLYRRVRAAGRQV
jgi:deoxyribodipyrimidine photo-lyase